VSCNGPRHLWRAHVANHHVTSTYSVPVARGRRGNGRITMRIRDVVSALGAVAGWSSLAASNSADDPAHLSRVHVGPSGMCRFRHERIDALRSLATASGAAGDNSHAR